MYRVVIIKVKIFGSLIYILKKKEKSVQLNVMKFGIHTFSAIEIRFT